MTTPISPATATLSVQLLPVWRAELAPASDKDAQQRPTTPASPVALAPETVEQLEPSKLRVEIDTFSGRFVQTFLSPQTQEVLLKYPREGELEFSRAITAYVKALNARD